MDYFCPKCGQDVAYLAPRCGHCGEGMLWDELASTQTLIDAEYVTCKSCHREVIKGSKFCNMCGNQIDNNGFLSYDSERLLPKCPECGEELDYGAKLCDNCGADIEWGDTKGLLIDFSDFNTQARIPYENLPRTPREYVGANIHYDTLTGRLKETPARAKRFTGYTPQEFMYNSFGIYS